MNIFAIDPGNKESAYVWLSAEHRSTPDCDVAFDKRTMKIFEKGKVPNSQLRDTLTFWLTNKTEEPMLLVIERVQSMGMAVGREVFETCEWIGRFTELANRYSIKPHYVYRCEEKITLCGDSKAKDANIRQALIDRFAKHDLKNGKGTKKNPDVFFGFKADIWAAMAVATTCMDQLAGVGHKADWRD